MRSRNDAPLLAFVPALLVDGSMPSIYVTPLRTADDGRDRTGGSSVSQGPRKTNPGAPASQHPNE
jgi:hypothetical protein